MSKSKREPIKPSNVWMCLVCEKRPEFEHKNMMDHLRAVHHIDTKNTKGKRSMIQHIDGADYFASTWEWEIGGMKFVQNTINPRDKDDPMSMLNS